MRDVVMSFKVSESEKDLLKSFAAKRDVPVSQIIREALKKYCQEEKE